MNRIPAFLNALCVKFDMPVVCLLIKLSCKCFNLFSIMKAKRKIKLKILTTSLTELGYELHKMEEAETAENKAHL